MKIVIKKINQSWLFWSRLRDCLMILSWTTMGRNLFVTNRFYNKEFLLQRVPKIPYALYRVLP